MPQLPRLGPYVHVAFAALPGSNAFTANTTFTIPGDAQFIGALIKYQWAAAQASGQAVIRVLLGDGIYEGVLSVTDPIIAVTQPFGRQQITQNEMLLPIPASQGSPIVIPLLVNVQGGYKTIRIIGSEITNTSHPGSFGVNLSVGF